MRKDRLRGAPDVVGVSRMRAVVVEGRVSGPDGLSLAGASALSSQPAAVGLAHLHADGSRRCDQ